MTHELGRASPIETDDGSAEGQGFRDGQRPLIMEGRMQEYSSGSHESQEFVATYAALKAKPVGHAPPTRSAGDALSVGSVSENPQYRVGMLDVTEGSNRQPTSLPRKEASH